MSDILSRLTTALGQSYRVERELGAGGMATVYLAHDLKHERDVAIKVLHPDLGAALGAERFLAEIKTTAKLHHPHILPLLDSGAADGLLYYVMPFARGETLRTRLERERQLSIDDALRIAREVAGALEHAHRQGIIHRDIKPENILLQDGAAVVADFGIALAVQSAGGPRMTQTGLSLGTPQYMSPEQAMGERTIDARSDIYALGAVAYEMLAGDPPFIGSTTQAIVAKVLTERPTPLRTVRDTVPVAVERSVLTALAKLPADRFPTATAFSDALQSAGTSVGLTPPDDAHVAAPPTPRRWLWPSVAAVLAVVSMGALAWAWSTSRVGTSTVVRQSDLALPDSFALYVGPGHKIGLSPDGARTVFVGVRNGRVSLLVRERNGAVANEVPGSEGLKPGALGFSPAFSPDGEWLVTKDGSITIRIPVRGGRREVVSDSAQNAVFVAPDTLLCSNSTHAWLVSLRGGRPRHLASADPGKRQRALLWPAPVFGTRRALIIIDYSAAGSRVLDSMRLGVIDLETGALIDTHLPATSARMADDQWLLLGQAGGRVAAVQFDVDKAQARQAPIVLLEGVWQGVGGATGFDVARDGSLVYHPADQQAASRGRLTIYSEDGKRSELLTAATDLRMARVSPDGKRALLFTGASSNGFGDTRVLDLATSAEGLALRPDEGTQAAWTADSRGMVFARQAGEYVGNELVRRTLDGGAQDSVLARISQVVSAIEISTQGPRTVLHARSRSSPTGRLLVAPTDSLSKVTPIETAGTDPRHPSISADGRWLAYSALDGSDRQVFVQPLDRAGGRWRLSITDGFEPRWSRDAQSVYFRSTAGVMRARLDADQRVVVKLDTLFADRFFRSTELYRTWDLLGPDRLLFLNAPPSAEPIHAIVDWRALLTSRAR